MSKKCLLFLLMGSLFTNLMFVGNDLLGRIEIRTASPDVKTEIKKQQKPEVKCQPQTEEKKEQVAEQNKELSDWNLFTLALMKVESEFDNRAVSSKGAKGYFQITPVYVQEVNRIYNTNYRFEQVTDFDTAYEIFDKMQQAHNPNYNMDRALELHNGEHEWYNQRVYKEMKDFQLYEKMRKMVLSKA